MSLARRFSPTFAALVIALLVLAILASVLPRGASATEFTVTNTNDSGAGSLRQAIIDANNNAGPDTISFNIPGCPPASTINVTTVLPPISGAGTTVDGTTEPEYAGTPLVTIDGSGAGDTADGLAVTGVCSMVKGLAITDFDDGIDLVADGASR